MILVGDVQAGLSMIKVLRDAVMTEAAHEITQRVTYDALEEALDSTEFWLNERLDDFVTGIVFHQAIKDIRRRGNRVRRFNQ